ncbi:MAG: lamin tail domain-containing protein [Myxococcales bacterium]|nr:lamin tail domain-containing protein [Myxococcales bacterium]
MRTRLSVVVLAACASGSTEQPVDAARVDAVVHDGAEPDGAEADAAGPDAAPPDAATADAAVVDARLVDAPAIDAIPLDAPVDGPPPVVTSLLLAEVVLAPTGGEFVEIVNPTTAAVDLSNYHLSDAPQYFRLPAGVAAVAADTTDFVARFPAGASIPAGGVITVALDTAANFTIAYPTIAPTYSLASGTMTVLTAGAGATLTNAGEPIVLFFWDGASDKVTDVDIMVAGTPTATNALANKSGVAIDGPDADALTGTYAADANTIPSQTAPASGRSTKRLALESAAVETQTGGNGVAGHDETSEQTNTTWDTTAYSVPTPGAVPAALLP